MPKRKPKLLRQKMMMLLYKIWARTFLAAFLGLFLFWPAGAGAFSDLSEDSEYFLGTTDLQARGLVEGYEGDVVEVEREINRAEALKVALSAFRVGEVGDSGDAADLPFSDLKKDAWYLGAISKALKLKIVSGYPDGTFKPEEVVNLVEALKILYFSADVLDDATLIPPYSDIDKAGWYKDFLTYAYDKRLIQAEDDGLLHPEKKLSRGEFFEMVARLLWVKENGNNQFSMYKHWRKTLKAQDGFSVNVPYGWQVIEQPQGVVVWRKDPVYVQESFTRVTPYSASLHIVVDGNPEKLDEKAYFDKVEERLGKDFGNFKRFDLKGLWPAMRVDAGGDNAIYVTDLYVARPDGSFVIFYANYGVSDLKDELRRFVIQVQHSLEFVEKDSVLSIDELLEETRAVIGVDGKGRVVLDKYRDLKLFETDAIGVGTGPVDYFYTAEGGVTIKYERSFDVILDMREGETSAF